VKSKPLTPRSPEWTPTAPLQVSATREVAATPTEVFEALADHESWPQWFKAIKRVERFGDLDEGIGSNRRVFINDRIAVDEEFIVWEPGRAWGFTALSATVGVLRSLNELVTIDEIEPGRVRVTYLMALEPKPWAKPLMWLAQRQLEKNLGEALDNLGPHIAATRSA